MQEVGSFFDSLSLFLENNILVVVFLVAIFYILKKSNQRQRRYLITVAVMAVLFVFNGIAFAVIKWIGEDTTYYRFFWICPIVLTSAYLTVELLFEAAIKKWQKACLALVFAVMVFGNYGQSFNGWGNIPSNVYQIEDDIIQLADLIDEHADGERTILLANNYISDHIREYNANVISNPDGTLYLDDIIIGNNYNYPASNVMAFMKFNMAEYIAIEKEKIGTNRLFLSIGSEKIGETDSYNLFYYDRELCMEEDAFFEKIITEKSLYVNSEYINISGLEEQKDYLYVTDLWVNTSQEQKQAIIDLANELQVEALIINSVPQNRELTRKFLEDELEGLKVPYVYNNGDIQAINEEKYSIVCLTTESTYMMKSELEDLVSTSEQMVLVLDNRILATGENEEFIEQLLADESPVIQIIAGNSGLCKEMVNDKAMLYGPLDVNVDPEQGFVTLLRLKGLEAE